MKIQEKRIGKKRLILLIAIGILAAVTGCIFYNPTEPVPAIRQELDMTVTNDSLFLSEKNFEQEMKETVLPYLETYRTEGYVEPQKGIRLRYHAFWKKDSKGTVAVSHGFSENMGKYQELAYYFLENNYSICIVEHRGHGYSTREVENKSKVHIDSMDSYVEDFKGFLDQVVVPKAGDKPLYLFSHSMGGCIGTLFLEKYPDYFDKVILNAPMLGINTGKYPQNFAQMASGIFTMSGCGQKYVFGHGDFTGKNVFADSAMTSKSRYDYTLALRKQDEHYQTSGATFQWLRAAILGTKKALKPENIEKINCPMLMFQAANDTFVTEYGEYYFVNRAKDIRFVYVPNSRHEIFQSETKTIIPYYHEIFSFLEKDKKR